ncbi:radical SAM protein [Streptomyces sp. NPDC056161]|uniref:radical SAM protein n=1 Tax=Streptomyces sp. NPDC056161 TaxID=3345732 RepID=UPI0035E0F8B4
MTVITEAPTLQAAGTPRFLWLDLTRKCQLSCTHCYNESGPEGTHGTMTGDDWRRVLDQAHAAGVTGVQLTGGEVTMHPEAPALVEYARRLGLKVEIYSNLVHVTPEWWGVILRTGASLATSYYSHRADDHNAVTSRPTHTRTRANVEWAVKAGIPIRVSVIRSQPDQDITETVNELRALGVRRIRSDHMRPFGRAAAGQEPCTDGLCGRCGDGRASIGPDGTVSPCVFSTWLRMGNIQRASLSSILGGSETAQANATIRASRDLGVTYGCSPDSSCGPDNEESDGDDNDDECSPGFPGTECSPRN